MRSSIYVHKSGVTANGDNLSIDEDKADDDDDKKPKITKESTKDISLMATIIGKISKKKIIVHI